MSTEAFYAFALIWLLSGLAVLLIGSRSARRKIKPLHPIFKQTNEWEDLQ